MVFTEGESEQTSLLFLQHESLPFLITYRLVDKVDAAGTGATLSTK